MDWLTVPTYTLTPMNAMIDNAFRRELARDVLLRLLDNSDRFYKLWEGPATIQALQWTDKLGE